ncbi:hypothetical protein [Paracoccus haeundaensis]|uniref:Uncharacterized protein n=1 Tax=Paracoccus haeundaensis TaxID=225362 RepID=A0A5C4R3U3_9RHOB|nr:hypothetical protein [Paracoccus haeundaensis]TNH38589.1 hypothetical protein FHD67_14075 [Paracoccus haeundaensis]
MARERIKTLRPDATGFGKTVTSGQGRPQLGTISEDAIESFKAKSAATPAAVEPTVHTSREDTSQSEPTEPSKAPERNPLDVQREPDKTTKEKPRMPSNRLASLVVPQRAGSKPGSPYSLRLRVLQRHADALERLEANGIPRATVLKAAYANMPEIAIEPRYVPQSTEASGGAEWSHRVTTKIEQKTVREIAATVKNGSKAPKSALILGQIEPAWFSALDTTIKEFYE